MKTFLLIVTIVLLIRRGLSTPRSLSKKIYEKYIEKEIKSMADFSAKKNEDELDDFKFVVCWLAFIFALFMLWYYIHIGGRFPNKMLYFMSVIQASTVLVSFGKDLSSKPFSTNPEDHKFNRGYALFNVVLDYMYYPIVIYMLLQ